MYFHMKLCTKNLLLYNLLLQPVQLKLPEPGELKRLPSQPKLPSLPKLPAILEMPRLPKLLKLPKLPKDWLSQLGLVGLPDLDLKEGKIRKLFC